VVFLIIHIKNKNSDGLILTNGHSRQIRETCALLVQICRGKSHFFQKWPLASVGESGESAQHGSGNVGESKQNGSANVGTSPHDKIGRFKHK
jgi:hypothetical protein